MILRFRYPIFLLAALAVSLCRIALAQEDPGASSLSGEPHGGDYDAHGKLTPEQLANVAILHIQEGRPNQAMAELNKAIVQYPTYAELFSVRGSLFLQNRQVSEALSDFETSLAMRPDEPKTLTNRAQAYRLFGRIEEALKDLNQAIELDPDLIPAHFNRGSIYFSSGEFDKALADFDQCIAIDPNTPAAYFNRASTYDALGQRDAAIKDLERFLERVNNEQWKKLASDLLKQWKAGDKPLQTTPDAS